MDSGSSIAIAHLAEALFFGGVPDDILVNILCRLDEDPCDLARLACVSTRFCNLIKTVCWKFRCEKILPLLVPELVESPSPALHPCPEPPGGWASLQKLLVCCPGLWHAGVLLENWDFGLDREIGWSGNFGYPDGFSYSDGSVALDSICSDASHSRTCASLDKTSHNRIAGLAPLAVEWANGLATCMVFSNVNDVQTPVSGDVCELDSINAPTHCSEAGMGSNENKEGINFDKNEADMRSNGKDVSMDKCECDKKGLIMGDNEDNMDSDGFEVGMRCENDEEGMNSVKTELGMDKFQHIKSVNKLGKNTHRLRLEKSAAEVINGVAEEAHVRDHEFQESAIRPHDDSLGSEATCMQSVPTPLTGEPLNLMNLETGCRHQNKKGSDSVGTRVSQTHVASLYATAQEKRMKERRSKSSKRQRKCHYEHCHVTTGPWNLSREQGNKLLANRFRADSLYICDWPGCLHPGDKRMYKLFRGVFKNFKHSHVWRNLKDMQAKATNVGCAFCVCKSTWDMVTTFCLKRSIEYHDDGEPVVRAYVCENGHVAGAWTDRPMCIL